MTTPVATNPLTFNGYVQAIGVLAVASTTVSGGVASFVDAPLQTLLPQILNYAELRCQRDIDFLQARGYNIYPLTAGANILQIPIDDFLTLETLESLQLNGATVVNSCPLTPVSREFIQNCYAGLVKSSLPRYFAMTGNAVGADTDTSTNVLLGPTPNFAFSVRVNGVIRLPSLMKFNTDPSASAKVTYISEFLPDLLLMASMIFVSAFQRNFSSMSDDVQMGQSYEKQYQALIPGAISEENRKKFQGSAWSPYSTPTTATPTR